MRETGWRSVLTLEESKLLMLQEEAIASYKRDLSSVQASRRALYLRAKKRMARAQISVDDTLEKA